MNTVDERPNILGPLLRVASILALGASTWFVVILFEEFVTADLRWALWLGGALLFVAAVWTGRRRFRACRHCGKGVSKSKTPVSA